MDVIFAFVIAYSKVESIKLFSLLSHSFQVIWATDSKL